MIHNYLITVLRSLRRNFSYSLINLIGFSVSLSCCLVIGLYVKTELSFESMHDKGDRLYRYIVRYMEGDQMVVQTWTPSGLATLLTTHFSGDIEKVTRVHYYANDPVASYNDKSLTLREVALVDSTFFSMFSFPLLQGDPSTVLSRPRTMVISRSLAELNFGSNDPVGKVIRMQNELEIEVTGVFEDMPVNSHLQFETLISMVTLKDIAPETLSSFNNWNSSTYILTRENLDIESSARKAKEYFYAAYANGAKLPADAVIDWWQPLKEIHFTRDIKGDTETANINYVYMAISLGLVILLMACFNFMNLTTAMAMRRAKEVGLRKTLGAARKQLVGQFLGEAFLQVSLAVGLALLLVQLVMPLTRSMFGLTMVSLEPVEYAGWLVALILLTTLLSGAYPALHLSSFRPARILKGIHGGSTNSGFRNVLTSFQFTASIFLLAFTWMVFSQLNFIRNKDLGFDKAEVVTAIATQEIKKHFDGFRERLLTHPQVSDVTISNSRLDNLQGYWRYSFPNKEVDGSQGITTLIIDENYMDFMGMKLKEGRMFSGVLPADQSRTYLVNEAFVREYGLEKPLETELQLSHDSTTRGAIVGIVEDFFFQPLHHRIKPIVMRMDEQNSWIVLVKLKAGQRAEGLAITEKTWKDFSDQAPFVYRFLDELIDENYRTEQQAFALLITLSVFASGIAGLGLLGLTAFMTLQRRKEIGIRKVLGSSALQLVHLFSRDISRLLFVSALLAVPLAWYVSGQWLQNFAYRIDVGFQPFVLSGVLVAIFTLVIVAYQSLKAAGENPSEVLRSE